MKHKIFTALFFVMCLFPLVGILFFGVAQAGANQILAFWPDLTDGDGNLNTSVLEEVSDYLGDRFALRQEMVSLQHTLTAAIFGESGVDDVIQGKDGWLFYADTLDDYEGINLMTDREIWSAARSLYLIQEYCESQGATFLFTIAPNKNTLYGEYMPDRYPASAVSSNADRLAEALEYAQVSYADLFRVFESEDVILYRKQDSHWNQLGAALAGDTLLEALGVSFTPFYGGEYLQVSQEIGDLYEMVYPTGTETDDDYSYLREYTFTYTSAIRTTADNVIRTENPEAEGSLLMFRDSFGNTLHTYMAEGFGAACFIKTTPYDLSLIESEQADTVVIELVERNLSWLNAKVSVFPAPVRKIDTGDGIAISGTVQIAVSNSGKLEGYVMLSGNLDGVTVDDDSPIYILVGSTVYEATPAGSGVNAFAGYLPETYAEGDLYVLYYSDGVLCGCRGNISE